MMIALTLYNIDVHVLHTELKFNECQKMIHEFVIKSKNVMILICSFYINFFRFNLQNFCCNVHFWNISMSEILLMQAIEHIKYFDQKHIVKIYNYIILNSFNIKQFKNNLIKMISDLIAELNDELFNIIFNIDTKKIDFDYWVYNYNNTLFLVSHNSINYFDSEKLVQNDELMYTLLEAMKKKS